MNLKARLENAIKDIKCASAQYEKGHSEAGILIPPSESLIDLVNGKSMESLPKDYVWFSCHVMHSDDRFVEYILDNAKELRNLISLLTLKLNSINSSRVAYRAGYIDGLYDVNCKVFKKTNFSIVNLSYYLEHDLSTDKDVKAFNKGLLGEPFDNPHDIESLEQEPFTERGSGLYLSDWPFMPVSIRPWPEIKPVRSYLMGLSFAIWRDFKYQSEEMHHFAVNPGAFDNFSRGITLDNKCIAVNGPDIQKVVDEKAYEWGREIGKYLLRKYLKYGVKAQPLGFHSIDMGNLYRNSNNLQNSSHISLPNTV